ncbi:unnamed protein product [Heligmosomoides polygyrus]|uniref:FBA_2 domain-containing protein n=1 Tax=Heligmosomoides polygyrus TaxID=6339 RepID=A0A183GND4_HELPZ|nr:unnamed protein product [Heligmosomoides polygyrus]
MSSIKRVQYIIYNIFLQRHGRSTVVAVSEFRVSVVRLQMDDFCSFRILPYIKDDFNIRKAIGLFPTVEKMADSPNGLRLKRVLATLDANDWLAKGVSFWLDFLPSKMKQWLVSWNLSGDTVPRDVVMSAAELLNMNVFRNIVHLSHDELNRVRLPSLRRLNLASVFLLWQGRRMVSRGISRLPRGHVLLDERGCEHAFVIRDGAVIADKVLQFIN